MKRITVFCGSSPGEEPVYMEQAYRVGQTLGKQNIELVYGGARVGLMGAVADGVLSEGGRVIGVLPKFLGSKEIAHSGLTELMMVNTMHERKLKMNELCDGFITLPGGFGTMEELFEVLTWGQLGLHRKPMGILNVNNFYTHLLQLGEHMVSHGFLKKINQDMILVSESIDELLQKMRVYQAPPAPQWITDETT
ncbi:MAG: TIGR00730 family Rossman fold protein [Bacteroidetes bacterium]|nr:TIGR00730 family Rossman fold protein [Bacteroidota bacterium]